MPLYAVSAGMADGVTMLAIGIGCWFVAVLVGAIYLWRVPRRYR